MNEPNAIVESASVNALTPMQLIQAVIERGGDVDPGKLEKLMALQERFEKSQAVKAYNAAMKICQESMPTVFKDAENTHTRRRYATLEGVQAVVKPVYTQHGFSLSFGTDTSPVEGHLRIVCDVLHVAGHQTRHVLDIPRDGAGARGGAGVMNAVQGVGSSVSYGRRYLTLMIFNVTLAGDDNDAQGANCSPTEVKEIRKLITEVEGLGIPFDHAAFLKFLGVSELERLPKTSLMKALHAINEKRRVGVKAKQEAGHESS